MNPRSFLLAPLALFAALSAAAQNGPAGKLPVLDDLLPVARTNAVAIFGVAESNLWFWSVDCHYQSEGFADDSTNALQWITFSFFDPHSAERVPRGSRSESTPWPTTSDSFPTEPSRTPPAAAPSAGARPSRPYFPFHRKDPSNRENLPT